MTPSTPSERYLADSVRTASGPRLLTMLYDRLALDLSRAGHGFEAGDIEGIHRALVHAQEIVAALNATLRPELWSGGDALRSLYDYLAERLVHANLYKDREALDACVVVIAPLRQAWHEAAVKVAADVEDRAGALA